MNRRAALKLILAAGASAGALVAGRRSESAMETNMMPTLFLAHGAPMLVDDALWTSELQRWASALPTPRAILMLSAHWTEQPVTLGATHPVPLICDFYGFPERCPRSKCGFPRIVSNESRQMGGPKSAPGAKPQGS